MFVQKVPKNKQKHFNFNKKGNCYFVDTYDKNGNLTWSGMYSLKSEAISVANYERKDKRNKKVLISKYIRK